MKRHPRYFPDGGKRRETAPQHHFDQTATTPCPHLILPFSNNTEKHQGPLKRRRMQRKLQAAWKDGLSEPGMCSTKFAQFEPWVSLTVVLQILKAID